jgi:hypothetical protein
MPELDIRANTASTPSIFPLPAFGAGIFSDRMPIGSAEITGDVNGGKAEHKPASADPAFAVCKTPLGRRLMVIRRCALENGMRLNTAEEFDEEIAEMRRY